jgi:hypothetical protein
LALANSPKARILSVLYVIYKLYRVNKASHRTIELRPPQARACSGLCRSGILALEARALLFFQKKEERKDDTAERDSVPSSRKRGIVPEYSHMLESY